MHILVSLLASLALLIPGAGIVATGLNDAPGTSPFDSFEQESDDPFQRFDSESDSIFDIFEQQNGSSDGRGWGFDEREFDIGINDQGELEISERNVDEAWRRRGTRGTDGQTDDQMTDQTDGQADGQTGDQNLDQTSPNDLTAPQQDDQTTTGQKRHQKGIQTQQDAPQQDTQTQQQQNQQDTQNQQTQEGQQG